MKTIKNLILNAWVITLAVFIAVFGFIYGMITGVYINFFV
jgi:hypothetical protein